MAYFTVLWLHSWNRWLVLLAALACLGTSLRLAWRRRSQSQGAAALPALLQQYLRRLLVGAVDLQLLLGLSLYLVLSPITRAARMSFPRAMHDATLRFWSIEHITLMLTGVLVVHLACEWSTRTPDLARGAGRMAWGAALALVCFALGVPWPFLVYGRALFRPF